MRALPAFSPGAANNGTGEDGGDAGHYYPQEGKALRERLNMFKVSRELQPFCES